MKGTQKYKKVIYLDGVLTSYKEVAKVFDIKEITARNIYNFEKGDYREYRCRKLSYRYWKMYRVFNINGHITDDHRTAANWLQIGQDTLYTYLCANKNGWNLNGNHVTFTEQWKEMQFSEVKRTTRPSELAELVEVAYTYDFVEYSGIKVVRKMSGDTLIKSYGWSVGQKYLQA